MDASCHAIKDVFLCRLVFWEFSEKPRGYHGICLLLVSVPLSSTGKETEALNVFANMSQVFCGRISHPPTISCSKHSYALHLSGGPGLLGPTQERFMALCYSPIQLEVTDYLEAKVTWIPLFSL